MLENLYFTKEEIQYSPSRKHGILEDVEDNLRRYGTELIQDAGILLKVPQVTICTAQTIFHRFFTRKSFKDFDVKDISMGSLFISCKYSNYFRKIRELLNVFTFILQRRDSKVEYKDIDYLDSTTQHYWDLKGDIMTAEFMILKEFGFLMTVELPHKFILNYIKLLDQQSQKELSQKSWNYLNDSMRTTISIQYRPEAIASSAIFLASRILNISLPESPIPWWNLFDTSKDEIDNIIYEINKIYLRPKPFYIKMSDINAIGIGDGKNEDENKMIVDR